MGDHNHPQGSPQEQTFNFQNLLEGLAHSYGAAMENNNRTIQELGQAMSSFMQQQASHPPRVGGGGGPKPKVPESYDGDRSSGKLDDHVRDLENWVAFHDRRHHWGDETEKVEQAATYLTGKMHRLFTLQRQSLLTFPDYINWLRSTFRDTNENRRLKDEWAQCVQAGRSVMEYATELLYLSARIEPQKQEAEIKEHFLTGLRPGLQIAMAEHPEWESFSLNDFIGKADRQDEIEQAKEQVRRRTGAAGYGRMFAITDRPRRGNNPLSGATTKPAKGTEEWQKFCQINSACFNCGERGHGARNCPRPRDTTTGSSQAGSPGRNPRNTGRRSRLPPRDSRSGQKSGKGRA